MPQQLHLVRAFWHPLCGGGDDHSLLLLLTLLLLLKLALELLLLLLLLLVVLLLLLLRLRRPRPCGTDGGRLRMMGRITGVIGWQEEAAIRPHTHRGTLVTLVPWWRTLDA